VTVRPRPNVFVYLLFALGAIAGPPVLVLGNRLAARWEEHTLRAEDEAAALEVEATSREIQQIMRSRRLVLEVVSGSVEAIGTSKPTDLQPIVDQQRIHSETFDTLYVANREGTSIVASSAPTSPGGGARAGVSYADRDYYKELVATGRHAYSKVQRGKISGVPNVHIAVPIHEGPEQRLMGFVTGGVQLEVLREAAEKSANARGKARVIVVDDADQILVDTRSALAPLSKAEGVSARAVSTSAPTTVVDVDETGQPVRATSTTLTLGSHTWRVWSMTPTALLEAEVATVRNQAFRITLVALAAALATATLAAWWLTGALRRARDVAKTVGAGRFDVPLEEPSPFAPREFVDLRDALSATLARLGDNDRRQRELLERLEATTAAQRPLAEAWAQVGEGVAVLDPEGRILFVNPAYERLLGRAPSELVGSIDGVFLDEARDASDRPIGLELRAAAAKGEPWRGDLQTTDFREDAAIHRVTLSPVLDDSGALERIVEIRQDITDQLRVQSKLRDTERLASIGTLAAGVAHEINNPLTYIKMNLELLRDSLEGGDAIDDAERAELLEALGEATTGVSRVGEISGSLLRLARKRKNTPAAVSLVEVVQSCARIAANELRHRARYVEELGELPLVSAIESELAQIVLNLLLNAAQAIAPGATNQNTVRVSGGVDEDGEFAWIEVSDTGSGIPRANLGRIFDPFFTTKDVGKGSGLGLAVSYSLAQAMGGDLTVASEVDRGTTFRLKLPVAQRTSDVAPVTRRPSLAKQRVLVVDDTEPVARSIAALLRDHEVQITSSGAQALEHLERGRFDVVISDVMMPQMTGIELFERAIEVRAELARRWIFVTGGTLTEDIDAALERIGAPIVTKPIARSDLLEAVASRVRAA
jgi:PAS domain S-box-containing protein